MHLLYTTSFARGSLLTTERQRSGHQRPSTHGPKAELQKTGCWLVRGTKLNGWFRFSRVILWLKYIIWLYHDDFFFIVCWFLRILCCGNGSNCFALARPVQYLSQFTEYHTVLSNIIMTALLLLKILLIPTSFKPRRIYILQWNRLSLSPVDELNCCYSI